MLGIAELKLEAGACCPDRLLPSFPQHLQILSWQTTKQVNSFNISISIYYSIQILIFDNTKPRQLKRSLHEPRINQKTGSIFCFHQLPTSKQKRNSSSTTDVTQWRADCSPGTIKDIYLWITHLNLR